MFVRFLEIWGKVDDALLRRGYGCTPLMMQTYNGIIGAFNGMKLLTKDPEGRWVAPSFSALYPRIARLPLRGRERAWQVAWELKGKTPPPYQNRYPEQEADGLNVAKVRDALGKVVLKLQHLNRTMAEALHQDCQLVGVSGSEIIFATKPVWQVRFQKPMPQATVNRFFSQVLGVPVTVRFVVEEG